MHYKNGRPAKTGDKVVGKDWQGMPVSGVVVATIPDWDACNIYVLPIPSTGLPVYMSKEFVHLDDAVEVPNIQPSDLDLTHKASREAERVLALGGDARKLYLEHLKGFAPALYDATLAQFEDYRDKAA